jgi:hypothetical protein
MQLIGSEVCRWFQRIFCRLSIRLVMTKAESWNHTLCACANQPAENVTAPGWQIRAADLETKFFLYTRQLGADFPETFFFTDACSKAEILRVPCRNADWVKVQILCDHWHSAGLPAVEVTVIPEGTTALCGLLCPPLWEARCGFQMRDKDIYAGSLHVPLPHLWRIPNNIFQHPKGHRLYQIPQFRLIGFHCVPVLTGI